MLLNTLQQCLAHLPASTADAAQMARAFPEGQQQVRRQEHLLQQTIAALCGLTTGDVSIKATTAEQMASGEATFSYGLSEREAGSDAAANAAC